MAGITKVPEVRTPSRYAASPEQPTGAIAPQWDPVTGTYGPAYPYSAPINPADVARADAQEQTTYDRQQTEYAQQLERQRYADMMGLTREMMTGGDGGGSASSSVSSRGGGGAVAPPVVFGQSGAAGGASVSPVSPVAPVNTDAAASAAFASAKDQVGETASGALAGLRSALGGRGMLGSGAERRGVENIVSAGQKQLGEVSRAQAASDVDRTQRTAEGNQSAALTGRGQDLGLTQSGNVLSTQMAIADYEGRIRQRDMDLQAQQAANSLAMQQAQIQATQRNSVLQGLFSALGKY